MVDLEQSAQHIAEEISQNRPDLISFILGVHPFEFEEERQRHIIARNLNIRKRTIKNRDFHGLDLTLFNFNGATFIECNFNGAIFNSTQLDATKFRKCDFTGAQLIKTEFKKTEFHDCTLVRANVANTKFIEVVMLKCNLKGIQNLKQVQFNNIPRDIKTLQGIPSHIELEKKEKAPGFLSKLFAMFRPLQPA